MPRKNLFDQHCPYVLHVIILKNNTHCSRGGGGGVARHAYDTFVWAVNPKIKQIVDLRKSDKLIKNYFHNFIIYIDFY